MTPRCQPSRPEHPTHFYALEPDPLASRAGSSVADLDPLNLDRLNPGLDHAFRPVTMPDQPVSAIGQLQVLPGGQKGRHLSFDGLFQQLACSRSEKGRQWIVDRIGLAKLDNAVILVHGVALPCGGSGRRQAPTSLRRSSHLVINQFPL
jgi:hypothetical protein